MIDYTVQLALEGDGFKDQQSGLTQTNYTLATDINAGEKYSFRVKARNSIGFSVFSPVLEIIAASKIQAPPADLVRNDELTNTTEVSFSWTAPDADLGTRVVDYTVQMKTAMGFTVVSA